LNVRGIHFFEETDLLPKTFLMHVVIVVTDGHAQNVMVICVWKSVMSESEMDDSVYLFVSLFILFMGFMLILSMYKRNKKEKGLQQLEKAREEQLTPPPQLPCPTCGGPLIYIGCYQRLYCQKCQIYS
jgi:hypothetical protein